MSTLTFVASLVRSLAWPLMIGLVIVMMRKPLGQLLERIRRASWKDMTVDLDQAGLVAMAASRLSASARKRSIP